MQNDTVVGFLADALSCVVTEERNGVFELSLTYPVTGKMFPKIAIDRFIKAKPNDTADLQLFRIYEVSKPMNGVVTVNAEHVSYALSNFPVTEVHITGTATQAINAVLSEVTYDLDYQEKTNPFMAATTDMDAVKKFSYKNKAEAVADLCLMVYFFFMGGTASSGILHGLPLLSCSAGIFLSRHHRLTVDLETPHFSDASLVPIIVYNPLYPLYQIQPKRNTLIKKRTKAFFARPRSG